MIPENRLSTTAMPAELLLADPQPSMKEALSRGGVALSDPSLGLDFQTWTLTTDGTDVSIQGETGPSTVLFSSTGVSEVSLAFDQNARPFVAFVDATGPKFWWYDSLIQGARTTDLPAGSQNPRCCLDDSRPSQDSASDIILAYVRAGVLYFRAQRDRYTIERQLTTGLFAPLRYVAMNKALRLQFALGITPP